MVFDFKLMLRLAVQSLFPGRRSAARLSPKRVGVLVALFIFYPLLELVHWFCFLLDDIFFGSYRDTPVQEPVFILGIPRSGTTFLHRLLARDEEQFTCMKLWELLLAPSVVQKKLVAAAAAVDRLLGRPVARLIPAAEQWCFENFGSMHKISLLEPEEDEFLMLHIFATIFLIAPFPFFDTLRPFARFDEELPSEYRARVMRFYRRCVQRHMYVFGRGRRFLSKNPMFSAKVRSLEETFPDAKIICTSRTPFDALPSEISIVAEFYRSFGSSPSEQQAMADDMYDSMAFWYRYPAEQLERWAPNQKALVLYPDLTGDPQATAERLYETFGIDLSSRFRETLQRETEKSRRYKSKHSYSLEKLGLSRQKLLEDYRDIFERFGFETEEK